MTQQTDGTVQLTPNDMVQVEKSIIEARQSFWIAIITVTGFWIVTVMIAFYLLFV